MVRYPEAEWVPWGYISPEGKATYFKNGNSPAAVVLHIMQGYRSTARVWAGQSHYGASWHYTVGRDGSVMQHLEHQDGGYHAGIPESLPSQVPIPTWNLWRGHGQNVNTYTIGIEHEGFSGEGFTPAQEAASFALCEWLAGEMGVPHDREHFPAHAEIDLMNRPNDFNIPAGRAAHYERMFDMGMTPEELKRMERLEALVAGNGYGSNPVLTGEEAMKAAASDGSSLFLGLGLTQAAIMGHIGNHGAEPVVIDHTHEPGQVDRS